MTLLRLLLCLVTAILLVTPTSAFSPSEVAVFYNAVIDGSQGVALYYAQARDIPEANVSGITVIGTDQIPGSLYVQYIATPISNYLTTHPNIKVIVLCYGIPYRIFTSDTANKGSVDSALMLLGNPNILTTTHWGLNLDNPFKNSSVGWDVFKDSSANTINRGNGLFWKLNYLVCRLDGYSDPKTTVTINSVNYSIPRDVKGMIDRAVSADSAGKAGLSDATAVLDDAPYSEVYRGFAPATEASLNTLLAPITGNQVNVWREPDSTGVESNPINTYAVGKSHVIAYASNGSYDQSADPVTTFWRPHNDWKPGAVALYWNVSNDAYYIRTPTFDSSWDTARDTDPAHIEPGILQVRLHRRVSPLNDGITVYLFASSQPQPPLAQAQVKDGIARIDLANIQWPSDHLTYFECHFSSNDPYHASERYVQTDLGVNLYEARTTGYTHIEGPGQSLSAELIRDGATATAGNVQEPGGDQTPDPNIILPKYASGYTWGESAWMGISRLSWQQVAIGDPLMAPFAAKPTITLASPSPADSRLIAGSVSLNATASPDGNGTIQKVEFWVTMGQSFTKIGSDTQAPYECVWNTLELTGGDRAYPDGNYTIEAVAYQGGSIVGKSTMTRLVVVDNASVPVVNITQPQNGDSAVTASAPVEAQADGSPTKVEFWLFGEGEPIFAGQDTSAPYQCILSSSTAQDGVYNLQAAAYYAAANSTSYSSLRRIALVNGSASVTSVGGLGSLTDGAQVYLINVSVTAGVSSPMDGAFYVEDLSRASGIRVETTDTTITQGTRVALSGTLHKTGTGVTERYVTASKLWNLGRANCPQPLGISNHHVGGQAPTGTVGITGGAGLYNTGLLVSVWGRVTYAGSNFIYIDDGTGLSDGNALEEPIIVPKDGSPIPTIHSVGVKGIRVYCGTLNKPGIQDYVSITGISSTLQIGSNTVRCIRPRSQNDIAYFDQYIPAIKIYSGCRRTDSTTMLLAGSKVRLVDDVVYMMVGTLPLFVDCEPYIGTCYTVYPTLTQLYANQSQFVTVCGIYAGESGHFGWPEITDAVVYIGGSTYGACSLSPGSPSEAMSLTSVVPADASERPELGGGPFRPWPYPTAEEILASESFKTRYNQPGAIGWALSQPDGTKVDLRVENICDEWYGGQVLGLREWFEPVLNGPNLFLYLDKPIQLDAHDRKMTAIDIVGATLMTLKDGRRAIVKPEAVYAYTDALGRWVPPLPWSKEVGDTKVAVCGGMGEWPWKLKVAP